MPDNVQPRRTRFAAFGQPPSSAPQGGPKDETVGSGASGGSPAPKDQVVAPPPSPPPAISPSPHRGRFAAFGATPPATPPPGLEGPPVDHAQFMPVIRTEAVRQPSQTLPTEPWYRRLMFWRRRAPAQQPVPSADRPIAPTQAPDPREAPPQVSGGIQRRLWKLFNMNQVLQGIHAQEQRRYEAVSIALREWSDIEARKRSLALEVQTLVTKLNDVQTGLPASSAKLNEIIPRFQVVSQQIIDVEQQQFRILRETYDQAVNMAKEGLATTQAGLLAEQRAVLDEQKGRDRELQSWGELWKSGFVGDVGEAVERLTGWGLYLQEHLKEVVVEQYLMQELNKEKQAIAQRMAELDRKIQETNDVVRIGKETLERAEHRHAASMDRERQRQAAIVHGELEVARTSQVDAANRRMVELRGEKEAEFNRFLSQADRHLAATRTLVDGIAVDTDRMVENLIARTLRAFAAHRALADALGRTRDQLVAIRAEGDRIRTDAIQRMSAAVSPLINELQQAHARLQAQRVGTTTSLGAWLVEQATTTALARVDGGIADRRSELDELEGRVEQLREYSRQLGIAIRQQEQLLSAQAAALRAQDAAAADAVANAIRLETVLGAAARSVVTLGHAVEATGGLVEPPPVFRSRQAQIEWLLAQSGMDFSRIPVGALLGTALPEFAYVPRMVSPVMPELPRTAEGAPRFDPAVAATVAQGMAFVLDSRGYNSWLMQNAGAERSDGFETVLSNFITAHQVGSMDGFLSSEAQLIEPHIQSAQLGYVAQRLGMDPHQLSAYLSNAERTAAHPDPALAVWMAHRMSFLMAGEPQGVPVSSSFASRILSMWARGWNGEATNEENLIPAEIRGLNAASDITSIDNAVSLAEFSQNTALELFSMNGFAGTSPALVRVLRNRAVTIASHVQSALDARNGSSSTGSKGEIAEKLQAFQRPGRTAAVETRDEYSGRLEALRKNEEIVGMLTEKGNSPPDASAMFERLIEIAPKISRDENTQTIFGAKMFYYWLKRMALGASKIAVPRLERAGETVERHRTNPHLLVQRARLASSFARGLDGMQPIAGRPLLQTALYDYAYGIAQALSSTKFREAHGFKPDERTLFTLKRIVLDARKYYERMNKTPPPPGGREEPGATVETPAASPVAASAPAASVSAAPARVAPPAPAASVPPPAPVTPPAPAASVSAAPARVTPAAVPAAPAVASVPPPAPVSPHAQAVPPPVPGSVPGMLPPPIPKGGAASPFDATAPAVVPGGPLVVPRPLPAGASAPPLPAAEPAREIPPPPPSVEPEPTPAPELPPSAEPVPAGMEAQASSDEFNLAFDVDRFRSALGELVDRPIGDYGFAELLRQFALSTIPSHVDANSLSSEQWSAVYDYAAKLLGFSETQDRGQRFYEYLYDGAREPVFPSFEVVYSMSSQLSRVMGPSQFQHDLDVAARAIEVWLEAARSTNAARGIDAQQFTAAFEAGYTARLRDAIGQSQIGTFQALTDAVFCVEAAERLSRTSFARDTVANALAVRALHLYEKFTSNPPAHGSTAEKSYEASRAQAEAVRSRAQAVVADIVARMRLGKRETMVLSAESPSGRAAPGGVASPGGEPIPLEPEDLEEVGDEDGFAKSAGSRPAAAAPKVSDDTLVRFTPKIASDVARSVLSATVKSIAQRPESDRVARFYKELWDEFMTRKVSEGEDVVTAHARAFLFGEEGEPKKAEEVSFDDMIRMSSNISRVTGSEAFGSAFAHLWICDAVRNPARMVFNNDYKGGYASAALQSPNGLYESIGFLRSFAQRISGGRGFAAVAGELKLDLGSADVNALFGPPGEDSRTALLEAIYGRIEAASTALLTQEVSLVGLSRRIGQGESQLRSEIDLYVGEARAHLQEIAKAKLERERQSVVKGMDDSGVSWVKSLAQQDAGGLRPFFDSEFRRTDRQAWMAERVVVESVGISLDNVFKVERTRTTSIAGMLDGFAKIALGKDTYKIRDLASYINRRKPQGCSGISEERLRQVMGGAAATPKKVSGSPSPVECVTKEEIFMLAEVMASYARILVGDGAIRLADELRAMVYLMWAYDYAHITSAIGQEMFVIETQRMGVHRRLSEIVSSVKVEGQSAFNTALVAWHIALTRLDRAAGVQGVEAVLPPPRPLRRGRNAGGGGNPPPSPPVLSGRSGGPPPVPGSGGSVQGHAYMGWTPVDVTTSPFEALSSGLAVYVNPQLEALAPYLSGTAPIIDPAASLFDALPEGSVVYENPGLERYLSEIGIIIDPTENLGNRTNIKPDPWMQFPGVDFGNSWINSTFAGATAQPRNSAPSIGFMQPPGMMVQMGGLGMLQPNLMQTGLMLRPANMFQPFQPAAMRFGPM